jgi:hypothetical protein
MEGINVAVKLIAEARDRINIYNLEHDGDDVGLMAISDLLTQAIDKILGK